MGTYLVCGAQDVNQKISFLRKKISSGMGYLENYKEQTMSLRNIAIIAHVDHGKTTLVDQMLKQSGTFRDNEAVDERAMDSNDLERERGITILAKCTSVEWPQGDDMVRINIIDTPGHADFGGEVERVLGLVDDCLLLVDVAEGVMPQTKFVLGKALKLGLKPIVVLNKADREGVNPDTALDATFDLFASLGADDDQLDFPVLYASGRDGWAVENLGDARTDLKPLFERIVAHTPEPPCVDNKDEAPTMLVSILDSDPYLGRLLTGRVESGRITPTMAIKALDRDGKEIERGRIAKILAFRGLKRVPVEEAVAGDIISIAGLAEATVSHTIGDPNLQAAIPAPPIDPPTLSILVGINNSPMAGREGDKVQSRVIRDRLMRWAEIDVAVTVEDAESAESFVVSGRGELQLGVMMETLRREGFELSLSRPQVIIREIDGERQEPFEDVTIDVDEEFSGVVIETLTARKADLKEMAGTGQAKTRLLFSAPSRSLIGYHGQFLTDTRGTGVMNRMFSHYGPYRGPIAGRRNGVLVSNTDGTSTTYALVALEDRGQLFIEPGETVYQGMIIGENSREDDLDVNPVREKKLTNVRASGKDETVRLTPKRRMSLEDAMAYIGDDELVEVTPKAIRLRKVELNPSFRKKRDKIGV